MMKIMGKREVGQLGIFDVIIIMSIANLMVIGIENYDKNYFLSLLPVLLITLLQKIISTISLKNSKIRNVIEGKKIFVIVNGKICFEEMKKENYNIDDLMMQLREKEIRNIDEVEYAVLETNGKLNIYKYDKKNKICPFPVIISGNYCLENLKVLNLTKYKIEDLLNKMDLKIQDINLAYYNDNSLIIPEDFKLN